MKSEGTGLPPLHHKKHRHGGNEKRNTRLNFVGFRCGFEKCFNCLTPVGIPNHDSYLRTDDHKGGVGKSTSAANIALGLAAVLRQAKAKNSRVLLIDTDSQAHATLVTTGRNERGRKSGQKLDGL